MSLKTEDSSGAGSEEARSGNRESKVGNRSESHRDIENTASADGSAGGCPHFPIPQHRWRERQATGDVILVRYADHFVMRFQQRVEAERFLEALRERLRQFGLELHSWLAWPHPSVVKTRRGTQMPSAAGTLALKGMKERD